MKSVRLAAGWTPFSLKAWDGMGGQTLAGGEGVRASVNVAYIAKAACGVDSVLFPLRSTHIRSVAL